MGQLLWSILRDLYVFLIVVFLIERFPGSDLMHDVFRKTVMVATIGVVIWKLFGGMLSETSSVGGPRVGGPLRQKKTEGGNGHGLEWAVCEMQGWRAAMEDATCIAATLPEPLAHQALFAVFDGHGGSQVSHIASLEFPKVLQVCANKLRDSDEDLGSVGWLSRFVNLRGKMRTSATSPRFLSTSLAESQDEAAEGASAEDMTVSLHGDIASNLDNALDDRLAVAEMRVDYQAERCLAQVFNIYADRPDEDLTLMFVHGIDIEEATLSDYQRFLRLHRKMIIKINNLRLKRSKRRPGLKIA
ncbi:unnamed protein product [Symbiodinium sp. CCMP2456]|nr:unnamed protein product [Symbiodinium sp. CCMP2456]